MGDERSADAAPALYIWWTDQRESEEANGNLSGQPRYLREQFASRYGRNGRGRLWTAATFGDVAVEPWPETPFARHLGDACAGIVIGADDVDRVRKLPGVITDFRLTRA